MIYVVLNGELVTEMDMRKVDLGQEEPRRQRDPGLAQQADGRAAHQGPHRPPRQARRRADLLPQHEDQGVGLIDREDLCYVRLTQNRFCVNCG